MLETTHYHPISPLILAGPPAVGKTYIASLLQQKFLCALATLATTRPPSPKDLKTDYKFLDTQLFQLYENQNHFQLTYRCGKYKYGLEKNVIENIAAKNKKPIIELCLVKVPQFLNIYPASQAVFLLPNSLELLEAHMRVRGDQTEEQIILLEQALKEIEIFTDVQKHLFTECYTITENNVLEVVQEIGKQYLKPT